MGEWYVFLSQISNALSEPVRALSYKINVPYASALIFGLLGALAPCQLSTNLSALGFIGRSLDRPAAASRMAWAYAFGKATVYTAIGSLAILGGLQLNSMALPVVIVFRKALGPLLLLAGLQMLGILPVPASLFERLARWADSAGGGSKSAFALGVVFSLAFCPTLFWLFFGLVIPMGISTTGGVILPALFALGTTVPLIAFFWLFGGRTDTSGQAARSARKTGRRLQILAGVAFLLAGLNETLSYWLT